MKELAPNDACQDSSMLAKLMKPPRVPWNLSIRQVFFPDFWSTWSTQNSSETPHPSQTGLTFTEAQVQKTGLEFAPQNWKRVSQRSRDQISFNGKHSYIIHKGLFHPTHRAKTYGKYHFMRIPPKIYCTYSKWQASDTGTLWQYSTNIQ